MTDDSRYRLAADGERLRHIEWLIGRYPDIAPAERSEILDYLRNGPSLDTGLLTGAEAIKPQLDRFRGDYADQLGLGRKHYAMIGVMLVMLAALVALLWNAGAGG